MPPSRILLWVSSIGVVALAARGWLVGPVPLWLAIGVGVYYVVLVSCGVMFMRLEMFGDAFWVGATQSNDVALTFDDGPSPGTTPLLLDALRDAGVQATFFVIGKKAEKHPELLQRIAAEGHQIGVHSYEHEWLYAFKRPSRVAADIARCQEIVESITGVRPTLFRPPVGLMSPRVAAGALRADVTLVGWTVRSRDGVRGATLEGTLTRVERGLAPGAILLLHDAAENDDFVPTIVAGLRQLLTRVTAAGYRVVPLTAFLERAPESS